MVALPHVILRLDLASVLCQILPSRGNVGSSGVTLLAVYRLRCGILSDFEVRKESSQVGSLGSLNTLAHTASQSFALLDSERTNDQCNCVVSAF